VILQQVIKVVHPHRLPPTYGLLPDPADHPVFRLEGSGS
jgi:hypothetical protein